MIESLFHFAENSPENPETVYLTEPSPETEQTTLEYHNE